MYFHPEKSLFELPAVRWIASITLAFAFLMSAVIVGHSNLSAQFNYAGFNNAIEIFRFPLGMLALGLSLIGLCGANHRSEQTKRQIERTVTQIELTRGQNNFANYYKHLEEFGKYCAEIKDPLLVISPRNLYHIIFPDSREGEYRASNEATSQFSTFIDNFISKAKCLDTQDRTEYDETIFDLTQLCDGYMRANHLGPKLLEGSNIVKNGENLILPEGTAQGLIRYFVETCKVMNQVLSFDVKFMAPARYLDVARIRIDRVPTWRIGGNWEPINIHAFLDGTAPPLIKRKRTLRPINSNVEDFPNSEA
jgi:hypothetical protein